MNLRYENNFEILNRNEQKGKAYTIYPKSNQEFEKIAKDINYIIKNNNLTLEDNKIQGDRRLGSTGRLFYRYEYKTKDLKDAILDLYNTQDAKKYIENYETNRSGDNYLASDMTIDDDPWYNFEP